MKTKTPDATSINLSDFGTQVDDTYHALRAFNFMLECMGETVAGSVSATINYGISQLLRRQVDDLEQITSKVFTLTSRLRDAERAVEEHCDRRQVPSDMVELPVYRPGMEHEMRARAAPKESAAKLQGVDLGAVARDTNLKEDTVRRVVERLLADPAPDPQAAVSNG